MKEVTNAVEWLRAISGWLLATDNDMKLPGALLARHRSNTGEG